jgi:hypothetical protein
MSAITASHFCSRTSMGAIQINSAHLDDTKANSCAHSMVAGPFHMSPHMNVVPTRGEMVDLLCDHKNSDISEERHSVHNHDDT